MREQVTARLLDEKAAPESGAAFLSLPAEVNTPW